MKRTKKGLETEAWVDEWTLKWGHPPTYQNLQYHFKLKSSNTAYYRCRQFRNKMKQNDGIIEKHNPSRLQNMEERIKELESKMNLLLPLS